MRPYHHAKGSASRYGGAWKDYISVHELIDSSKLAFANLRHRMILHSVDFGYEVASRIPTIRQENLSKLVRDHVVEDIGFEICLEQWLSACQPEHMPKIRQRISKKDFLISETKRTGIKREDLFEQVYDLVFLPVQLTSDNQDIALSIMANSFGVALVGNMMGGLMEVDRGKIFDPAWSAENLIYQIYHTIPDVRLATLGLNPGRFRILCEHAEKTILSK